MALLERAEWLDRLHDDADVSLLARRRWLQSWADASSSWEPWVLALVSGGEPRAMAPLARRRAWWGIEVVSIGDNDLVESPIVACDETASASLAAGLVDALESLGRPWMLRLRQLPVGSVVAAALGRAVSTSALFRGAPLPVLRFDGDRPPRRWLTRNTAAAFAKARNRINRDGHAWMWAGLSRGARSKTYCPS